MNVALGLSAIYIAMWLFGWVMEWLTQHDLLIPAFWTLVAVVLANAVRGEIERRLA